MHIGTAIRGLYRPANKKYRDSWAAHYICRPATRSLVAKQMRDIRAAYGANEALEFRNYLLWLGVFPVRLRKPSGEFLNQGD